VRKSAEHAKLELESLQRKEEIELNEKTKGIDGKKKSSIKQEQ
jgi:hypothetical protein